MLATMTTCPDENALVRFSSGQLSGEDLGPVEKHLDTCSACRTLIAQLTSAPKVTDAMVADGPVRTRQGSIGRYQIEKLVGGGGMGMVYAARDHELNRVVAVKLLRIAGAANTESRARLLREAQTMAKLSHPNLVPIFELGSDQGDDYLAMELIDGPSLDQWLRDSKRDWREIVKVFIDAGRGLEAAHHAGIVHRDFKPANVLIGPDGRARVTDFGLSRPDVSKATPGTDSMELTREGSLMGTPAYMSPEQLDGQVADVRSDQFSFCVALAEALTGHRPFPGRSLEALRASMRREKPPQLELKSRRVKQVLLKGMSIVPGQRFPSMAALLAQLDAALRPAATKPTLVGIAVAVALAVFGFSTVSSRREPAPAREWTPPKTIGLTLGQRRAVWVRDLQQITSFDRTKLEATMEGNQSVSLFAIGPGTSTLVMETRASPHEPRQVVEWEITVIDADGPALLLQRGQLETMNVPGATRVISSDPTVLEARLLDGDRVVLNARKEGNVRLFAEKGPNGTAEMWRVGIAAAPPVRQAFAIAKKEQKVLTIPGMQRVAVGDSDTADVKTIGNNQLLVIGVGEGTTSLLVWTSSGERLEWDVTITR